MAISGLLFTLHEMIVTHHSTNFFLSVLFRGMDFCFAPPLRSARSTVVGTEEELIDTRRRDSSVNFEKGIIWTACMYGKGQKKSVGVLFVSLGVFFFLSRGGFIS